MQAGCVRNIGGRTRFLLLFPGSRRFPENQNLAPGVWSGHEARVTVHPSASREALTVTENPVVPVTEETKPFATQTVERKCFS